MKTGVIVTNLGTPASTQPKDVARYLREFLMDPYVLDLPWFSRFLLVNGIITPFRSKKSARAYEKIWTSEGSPLLTNSERFVAELQNNLGPQYQVELAMRYGKPSFTEAIAKLSSCAKIILFPQYPQFAESSYKTAVEKFEKVFGNSSYQLIPPFYSEDFFINPYVKLIENHLSKADYDHLLLSFHGLPERHIKKLDSTGHCGNYDTCCENSETVIKTCYRAQCYVTTQKITKRLGLKEHQFTMSFQSRLGRDPWIPPYTDEVLGKLVEKGVRRLAVTCPAFMVDCLETLEEVAMEAKNSFLRLGGKEFYFIPCLNDFKPWVEACAERLKSP